MTRHSALTGSIALSLLGACMPTLQTRPAFSSRFTDNARPQIQEVYARLPSAEDPDRPHNALGVPLLAAVTHGATNTVVLYDLAANRQIWSANVNAASSPYILGDILVIAAGSQAVALDLRSGQQRWTRPLNSMNFMGAAREGDHVVLVTTVGATGNGARAGRVEAVDAHSGDVDWSHQVAGILGRPAVASGFAFVPWDRQSIAVLDLTSGVERARLRATDDVISWVLASSAGLYYGASGAYRWTPGSATGTRVGSVYMANPLQGVPGDPPLYRDAFTATTGTRTARDKIRFAFTPHITDAQHVGVLHNTIYLAYYRFIVALNVTNGEVRWARAIGPEETASAAPTAGVSAIEAIRREQATFSLYDVEGMVVTPTALVVTAGNGRVRSLDPMTGAIVGTQDLHADIAAIATDLGGYHSPRTGNGPPPDGTAREQLVSLIRDPDNRLVPIRGYLVRLLAARPEQEATHDLLELYREHGIPLTLRQEIATALRGRRNGAQYLVQALDGEQSHYNFLENRQAPPLEVIAPTLAAMGAREAVPVLLQHMLDHETPIAALPAVINAIAQLADASVIPQLQAFVMRYKSDSAFAGDKNVPLQTAVAGIFHLGDATAREWLTSLSHDESAQAPLRSSIAHLFEDERAGTQARSAADQIAHAHEVLEGRLNTLRAAIAGFPRTLTRDAFDTEWDTHLDDLRDCAQSVLTRMPDLNQIRVEITLRSETPNDLFQTTAPIADLPVNATPAQQLHALETQTQWAERQIARLGAHQSTVRTIAYSPQDAQMQSCMDHVLRPAHFAGFGRGISTRTFQESLSTVRSRAATTFTPGFGSPRGSSALVPWFLVSSASLNPTTGQLIASAHPAAPTHASTSWTAPTHPAQSHRAVGTSWAEAAEQEESPAPSSPAPAPAPLPAPDSTPPARTRDAPRQDTTAPTPASPAPTPPPSAPTPTPAPTPAPTRPANGHPWWEE